MTIRFQSPGETGNTLLQSLTDASIGAGSGGAVFAWATSFGAAALLSSPDFEAFLSRAHFDLIVGTDSITDTKAIAKLSELAAQYPLLTVRALVNDARPLFHPKLTWFVNSDSLTIVLGSGNLTRGGLIGNWEAFTESQLPLSDLGGLQDSIADWLLSATPGLLPLDDPRVLARVAQNAGDERSVRKPASAPAPVPVVGSDYSTWLIAELNKSRKSGGHSMFSQASFDHDTFTNFFDFGGHEVDIVLFPVDENGLVGPLESRKGRYKAASVNYYFELGEVQGIPYPSSGRPIAVFGRLTTGGYTYRVSLPGDLGHDELAEWLVHNAPIPNPTRMRRAIVTTQELTDAWPANPLIVAELPGS